MSTAQARRIRDLVRMRRIFREVIGELDKLRADATKKATRRKRIRVSAQFEEAESGASTFIPRLRK